MVIRYQTVNWSRFRDTDTVDVIGSRVKFDHGFDRGVWGTEGFGPILRVRYIAQLVK